jgi:hypothetical protein
MGFFTPMPPRSEQGCRSLLTIGFRAPDARVIEADVRDGSRPGNGAMRRGAGPLLVNGNPPIGYLAYRLTNGGRIVKGEYSRAVGSVAAPLPVIYGAHRLGADPVSSPV